jgi:hypothetical protein
MSFKTFLDRYPEVAKRLTAVLNAIKLRNRPIVPIKIPPRTKNPQLLGTAFDYLIRFELQRQAPYAITRDWEALSVSLHQDPNMAIRYAISDPLLAEFEAEEIKLQAQEAVRDYIRLKEPSSDDKAKVAVCAIRLAHLDSVARANVLGQDFREVKPEDVQDLLDLLAIVPFGLLIHHKRMLLNPTIGKSGSLVGGADADLIAGDALIEFKVSKENTIKADYLRQLLLYLIMCRHEHRADHSFPEINRIGVYLCRHGYLWTDEVSWWADKADFVEFERWFIDYASRLSSSRPTSHFPSQI